MKTRYIYRNKHGVYCLRFELQSKSKNTYRQLLISLRTKEPRIALQHYSTVMPEVYRVLCNYSDSLRLNLSEAPNVFEVKRTINELVARIVETDKAPYIAIHGDTLRNREAPKTYHFCAPLIALHTGMRTSEIASLDVQDVCYEDGVLVFSVNNEWKSDELKKSQFSKSKKAKDSLCIIPCCGCHIKCWLA